MRTLTRFPERIITRNRAPACKYEPRYKAVFPLEIRVRSFEDVRFTLPDVPMFRYVTSRLSRNQKIQYKYISRYQKVCWKFEKRSRILCQDARREVFPED